MRWHRDQDELSEAELAMTEEFNVLLARLSVLDMTDPERADEIRRDVTAHLLASRGIMRKARRMQDRGVSLEDIRQFIDDEFRRLEEE